MIAVEGIYHNGMISLFEQINIKKPIKVIVTFLEKITDDTDIKNTEKVDIKNFSFLSAIEATKDINISLSDALIEERRKEL